MAKRRPAGDGMVRKRDDGRWEGRIVIGHKENGEPLFRHVYAKTQKALLDKLHQNIECYRDVELTEDSRMTLSEWLDRWLTEYKAGTVRSGTLKNYRCYIPIFERIYLLLLIWIALKSIIFETANVPTGRSSKYSTSSGLILSLYSLDNSSINSLAVKTFS